MPPRRNAPALPTAVAQSLVSTRGTKTAIVHTLKTLSAAGMLKDLNFDDSNEHSLKKQLTEAATVHANTNTIYGPIVQRIEINVEGCKYWEYVNPFAYLYYLSTISSCFSEMMRSACRDDRPVRIVIYADALIPGNPFRPEASRTLMCIYWAIADWPQHVLNRSFAWPVFSILRTSVIEKIPGGLGYIMRVVLKIFFATVGASFTTGVHIVFRGGDFVATGIFAGFLADLLGHKEITDWKGTNGVYCCMTCDNVLNCLHRAPKAGEVRANCSDPLLFHRRTNQDVYNAVDELAASVGILGKTKFKELELDKGFNWVPEGLLLDAEIRGFYKPVDHTIRDWQHILCQDGVANTHIFNVLKEMKQSCNVGIDRVQTFSQVCNYPSSTGKLDKSAFGQQRLRKHTIASFSSTILNMVPVLYLFMKLFVKDRIPEHFAAFETLYHIIGLLRMGAEDAVRHANTLLTLISKYTAAVVLLYGDYVKPKGHHLFHVIDGMIWIGRLLCCFVTERKHRAIKAAALYVFRHLEHTVLVDVVNQAIQQIIDGHDLYSAVFLVHPRTHVQLGGFNFFRSRSGIMRIGQVSAGDLVIDDVGGVGKVISFWQRENDHRLTIEIDAYPCVNNDISIRATLRSHRDFVTSESLIDTCIWVEDSPGIIHVTVPPALLYNLQ